MKKFIEYKDYPLIKDCIENNNCNLTFSTEGNLEGAHTWRVGLETKNHKSLASSRSTVSIDKCMASVERKLREKLNEEYDEKHPFKLLIQEIKKINLFDTRTYGSDKIGGFSLPGVNYGVDENDRLAQAPVEIKIGNAGNTVIQFDALQDSYWIKTHASWVNNHLTGHSAFLKVVEAISSYLYADIEVRREEMTERMNTSGWRVYK